MDGAVQLRSDGLALSPADYARLLGRLADDPGIEADEYSRHGVVASLEARFAALLGKDMAVYLPTGTLANHLALRRLARDGRRVLVQQESHVYNDEGDCAQQLSGLTLVPLAPGRATFTLADVEAELRRVETGRVHTAVGAISIESPVRRIMGEVFDFAEMQKIAAFARERRIGLHLDGARLFLASAYTGISPATCAALFDTVYVSLYKYFNAAAGAMLAGPRDLLENLYHQRRMFGGGLRQVGPMRLWRCTISTAFSIGSPAPWRRPTPCLRALASIRAARSRGHRPAPMSCACGLGRRCRELPELLLAAASRSGRPARFSRGRRIRAVYQRDNPPAPDWRDRRNVHRRPWI